MLRKRTPPPEVHRITGAQRPHSDDLDQRMGRYLVSMLIRTACVILVLVIHSPVRWVFAVGAVLLPYIAVVMANTGQSRRDPAPPTITVRPAAGAALPAADPFPPPPAHPFPPPPDRPFPPPPDRPASPQAGRPVPPHPTQPVPPQADRSFPQPAGPVD